MCLAGDVFLADLGGVCGLEGAVAVEVFASSPGVVVCRLGGLQSSGRSVGDVLLGDLSGGCCVCHMGPVQIALDDTAWRLGRRGVLQLIGSLYGAARGLDRGFGRVTRSV